MELESIIKQLNHKFLEPLPEFYERRIIIWNDEDKDFIEEIENIELDTAKILVLSENNNFEVKRILTHDDLTSNYLLYNPFNTDMEDDWLLDIKLYSDEFRADQISMWMQEMNIISTPALRKTIEIYKGFLNAISRRKLVSQFSDEIDRPSKLQLAVLASICKVDNLNPKEIIKAVMADGEDIKNGLKMSLLQYGASDTFWSLANKATGFDGVKSSSIDQLNAHIILSAAHKTMDEKVLSGLDDKYSPLHDSFCYELVYEWLHSDKKEELLDVLRNVEKKLNLVDIFNQADIDDLVNTEILPCIDEIILGKLMERIIQHTISTDQIIAVCEKRRTMVWYQDNQHYYMGLYQVALMQKFQEGHITGFIHTNAKEMWKAYVEDYYLMDTYYRKFHISFAETLKQSNPILDDDFKSVADEMDRLYKNWFLDKLLDNWTKVSESDFKEYGAITGIDQQVDFYRRDVNTFDNKVFVIISDALRYEVATSIYDQLRIETKADVRLDSQQAIFPTITKFGMAALLPKRKMSLENKNNTLRVMLDGNSSDATYRDSILKQYNPNSIAVKYSDLIVMKNADRRELIKGQDIIYIYHDVIDSASHHDERGVFSACDIAQKELVNLVKIITGSLNGLNVLITADHGFLYTYQPLTEDDKMDRSSFKKDIIEQGRRYIITDNNAAPDYLFPVKGFYNEDGYQAFSPRENIRIKGAGGLNYVHGGTSLQEIVVPVIKYKYLRSGYKSYERNKDKYDVKAVTVSLLSSSRKISNMIFNLNFYQKEPVGDKYVSSAYEIYFTNANGRVISDKQKIIADRTSKNNKDRDFRCMFHLNAATYSNTAMYYLVIEDENTHEIIDKEEFQIDISFVDDFDF